MTCDESRFGLKTWLRRRWCPKGVRPPWIVEEQYHWVWLYAAIEPTTGAASFLLLPGVDGECLEVFLAHLHQEQGPEPLALVLDNAPSQQSSQVTWPAEIKPLYLPAYSPELNPVEQLFRLIRKHLSNRIFEDLEALYQALIEVLQEYWQHPENLIRLTAYPWWVQGCTHQDNFNVN